MFGSDGSDGEKGKSILYSVDPDTGAVIDKIDNVDSAIRSTVAEIFFILPPIQAVYIRWVWKITVNSKRLL